MLGEIQDNPIALCLQDTTFEIENNAYTKFWRDNEGTIIVFFF